jgi:hypothetical protein
MARYTDRFLNALMYPHRMTARAELYYGGAKVADINLASSAGSVTADRGAASRRTFSATIDPAYIPKSLTGQLTPYGSQLKVWRGIRYADATVEEYPVFFGRVDSMAFSRDAFIVTCSDMASQVADTRFEVPRAATRGNTVVQQMKDLILEAVPGVTIDSSTVTATTTVGVPAVWDRERVEALNNLGESIGAEWYAMPDQTWKISPLPAAIPSGPAVWIIDSGDIGVAVERTTNLDRATVFNAVVVNGEPADSKPPAYGVARDTAIGSPTVWGGAFGKIPNFFSSQFVTTNAQAVTTAQALLGQLVAGTRAVNVSCVPNPKLRLADVVMVSTDQTGFDGLYYVQSFTLPIDPSTPMSIVCNAALDPSASGDLVDAPIVFAEGISWP